MVTLISSPAASGVILRNWPCKDWLSTPARTSGHDAAASTASAVVATTDQKSAGCARNANGAFTQRARTAAERTSDGAELKELFLLDPGVVYLNHGSYGACPRPVFDVYQGWQRELEREPVDFLALQRRLPELLDAARLQLAAYVGSAPGDLAFYANSTSGLNAVVRSLRLAPGDQVLIGDAE